jgi:hypothetical protein
VYRPQAVWLPRSTRIEGPTTAPGGAPRARGDASQGHAGPDDVLVTRASGFECIEKRRGAAYVLLTETREGYAHRLRATDHPHAAEDESRCTKPDAGSAWPHLWLIVALDARAVSCGDTSRQSPVAVPKSRCASACFPATQPASNTVRMSEFETTSSTGILLPMGPIALFDKSFLQSLSVDESVWFDNFFIANVCPIFYAETLADLKKPLKDGRSGEDEVGRIANKFPEKSGSPNAYHVSVCLAELLGEIVPMTGQIMLGSPELIHTSGGAAAVYQVSSEANAFERWGRHEFSEVEHVCARAWRDAIPSLDQAGVAQFVRQLGIKLRTCRSAERAKALATRIVSGGLLRTDPMQFAFALVKPSADQRDRIFEQWRNASCPPLTTFAPYTAHVLTVQFFFCVAVAARVISERPSNRIDMAYLFYSPFCQLFVSSDKLHRNVSPLFLRANQEFVWGPDLKRSLAELNQHYSSLPETTKQAGIMSFAPHPPTDSETLVARLWDRLFSRRWRMKRRRRKAPTSDGVLDFINEIRNAVDKPTAPTTDRCPSGTSTRAIMLKRRVRRQKGSWYQVPKDLEDNP